MTKYRVTAKTGYKGVAEGEEFDADLTEDEERRAVERGSLEVVGGKQRKKDEEEEKPDA